MQGLGWTVFEPLVIATAAAALSEEVLGFRAQWAWTIAFGAFALALGLAGPIGFARRFVRRISIWAVPLSLGYLTWWALDGAGPWHGLGSQAGEGGADNVRQGIDLVVAVTVSWVPLAADYTRFARDRNAAFWRHCRESVYFLPDDWLLLSLGHSSSSPTD